MVERFKMMMTTITKIKNFQKNRHHNDIDIQTQEHDAKVQKLQEKFENPHARDIYLWNHYSWGDNIYFEDFLNRRLVGWMTPKPKIGDIIYNKMESGKIGVFCVESVEHTKVYDMFWLNVSDLGYFDRAIGFIPTSDGFSRSSSSNL